MKPYVTVGAAIAAAILLSFLIVEALAIPILTDPSETLARGGVLAALSGAALLLADVFVPVPSSLVMIAHGAAFGVLGGFLLSLAASVGGAMIGWWIGHRGSGWMDRLVTVEQKRRANRFIARYGLMAIIISRMIPILAETVALMSGTTDLGWKRVLGASTLGSIPPALVYAIAGSFTTEFAPGIWAALGVFLFAGIGWWIGHRFLEKTERRRQITTIPFD